MTPESTEGSGRSSRRAARRRVAGSRLNESPAMTRETESSVGIPRKATLKEQPDELKPRERMLSLGPAALSDAELIAILLRTGLKDMTAVDLASDLLQRVRGLSHLARMTLEDLRRIRGVGLAKACQILAGLELGKRALAEAAQPKSDEKFNTPERVYEVFAPLLMLAEEERVIVVYLNTKLAKMGQKEISRGGLSHAVAEPREIFKEAVSRNAASIILIHNHPSGDPSPSDEDRRLTGVIRDIGKMFQIPLTDHIIIGRGTFYSFERGKVTSGSLMR
jgi:DNA repair protein RadC